MEYSENYKRFSGDYTRLGATLGDTGFLGGFLIGVATNPAISLISLSLPFAGRKIGKYLDEKYPSPE